MKIDFTKYELPVDALRLSHWQCIVEEDISPKNSDVPWITRLYEIRPCKAEFKFAPKFEISIDTDLVLAAVWPNKYLNSIEIRGQECSIAEVVQLTKPIIEAWGLTCRELVAQPDGQHVKKYSDAKSELAAWCAKPDQWRCRNHEEDRAQIEAAIRSGSHPSYLADSATNPSPGIAFFRLMIFLSETNEALFSLRLVSYWRQLDFGN